MITDAPDLLRQAADLVDRALRQLDVHETTCAACARRDFTDRVQASIFEQLAPTPEKLRATANRLAAVPVLKP